MTDRLKEIKARYTDMESWVLHTMDHVVVDHDIAWLIAEVERLRDSLEASDDALIDEINNDGFGL